MKIIFILALFVLQGCATHMQDKIGEEFKSIQPDYSNFENIKFGVKKMGVAPAGIKFPNTGHHHLIIDGAKFDMKLPLPMSDKIKHYGAGQTETVIELEPGKHTLKLVFADHLHRLHEPPVISEEITITVKE